MLPQEKVTDARLFVVGTVRPHERVQLKPMAVGDLVLVSYDHDGDDPSMPKKVTVAKIYSTAEPFTVQWYGAKSGKYSKMMKNKFYPGWKDKRSKKTRFAPPASSTGPGAHDEPYLGVLPYPAHAIVDYGFSFTGDTWQLKEKQLRKLCATPAVLFKFAGHDEECTCIT